MQTFFFFTFFLIVALFSSTGELKAGPITFDFTGTITSVPNNLPPSLASIRVGTSFSGSYTFDSGAPDLTPGEPQLGIYGFSSPFQYTLNIGGKTFTSRLFIIEVHNNAPFDQYSVGSLDVQDIAPEEFHFISIQIYLNPPTPTAFSTKALPLIPPNLADFSLRRILSFAGLPLTSTDYEQIFFVEGSIDSLTVSPIPVPTTTPPLAVFPKGDHLFEDVSGFLQDHGQEFSPESLSFLDSLVIRLDSFLRSPTLKKTAEVSASLINFASTFTNITFALSPTNTLEEKLLGIITPLLTPYIPPDQQHLIRTLGALKSLSGQIALHNPAGTLAVANAYIWGGFVAPQLRIFANDPFDPNYQSAVVPNIPPVTPLLSTGNHQLDDDFARLQAASIQAFIFLQAVQVSFDRYNSALAGGDPISAGLQLEAILHYLALYDDAIMIAANLWNQLPAFLQDVPYDPAGFQNLQAEVAATNFPPAIINFLNDIGLMAAEIDSLRTTLLSLDSKQFSGTLFSVLYDLSASVFSASTARTFIDIKPGDFPNSINPKSKGKIPVAILSTNSLDAPSQVDRASLTFGRTGGEHSLAFCNANGEDVNRDGLRDLVCHFYTRKTSFKAGDSDGILKGESYSGMPFISTDSVQIVPSR